MAQEHLPTELILGDSDQSLGQVYLEEMPQPGTHLFLHGQTYTVLERRHQYRLKASRYNLYKIVLYVQVAPFASERSTCGDRLVIGDITCRFNAQSELIRCGVNPLGPCQGCQDYQAR